MSFHLTVKHEKKFLGPRKNKTQLICNLCANIPIFAFSLLRVSYYLLCSSNLQTKIFSSQTSTRSHLPTPKPWQFLFIFKSFSPDILTSHISFVLPLKPLFFMIKSLHLEISFYFFYLERSSIFFARTKVRWKLVSNKNILCILNAWRQKIEPFKLMPQLGDLFSLDRVKSVLFEKHTVRAHSLILDGFLCELFSICSATSNGVFMRGLFCK